MKMPGRSISSMRNSKGTIPKEKAGPRYLRNSKVANMTKEIKRKNNRK